MEDALGTQARPPDRGSVKPSPSPPPSAPSPGSVKPSPSPPTSAPAPVLVETPASPLPSTKGLTLVKTPTSPPPRAPGPCLVKPPATPPRRGPGRKEPSPEETRGPSWLVLDRFVHRSSWRHGIVERDATTSEISHDCMGRPIRVSLRVADLPAVSRLYLHWLGRPAIKRMPEPEVIAAHRNSILFLITVPFEDPDSWNCTVCFPVDYFVYSATSSSSPPSLTRLVPCIEGGVIDPEDEKLFLPYSFQQQRTMLDQEIGLLCHGDDGEFTVADLTCRRWHEIELCMLHHAPPSNDSMEWRVKKVQITPSLAFLRSWRSDVVVAVDERRLCWADYYQGLLLIDVLTDDQPELHYIPLPEEALRFRRPYIDAFSPDPFRCVCVTDVGIIKLVCIIAKGSSAFFIKTWTFNIRRGKWKDCRTTMEADEFFGLYDPAQTSLPQVQPSFPVVSLVNPHVISFLLKEEDQDDFWMIEVDMKKREMNSSALYINEEEEGYSRTRVRRYCFRGHYFIPSRFSSYLSKDGIVSLSCSREHSEMLQKTVKQQRAMQKLQKAANQLREMKKGEMEAQSANVLMD